MQKKHLRCFVRRIYIQKNPRIVHQRDALLEAIAASTQNLQDDILRFHALIGKRKAL